VLGDNLADIVPGSPEAARVKEVLIAQGVWSQYLEVGIGPDAEIFTKAPVLAAVGTGADVGIHSGSVWNNPEPEVVLAVNSRGETLGAALGNDVNLRDFEGRSALAAGQGEGQQRLVRDRSVHPPVRRALRHRRRAAHHRGAGTAPPPPHARLHRLAAPGQVGNRARHLQRAVRAARRPAELGGGVEELRAVASSWHAVDGAALQRLVGAALALHRALARRDDAARMLAVDSPAVRRAALGRHRRHFDVQVDAVQQRAAELALVARDLVRRAAAGRSAEPSQPQGQGFIAATSWKRAGNSARRAAREMVIVPVSSGSRSASSAARGNSGNSSRNSTPWCASEISPGRGGEPPPTSATALAVWCGAQVGRCASSAPARSARPGWRPRRSPAPRRRSSPAAGRQSAAPASTCPNPARPSSAGCGRRPRRSPARAGRRPGP
jgi:hypothetical protein